MKNDHENEIIALIIAEIKEDMGVS